MWDFSTEPAYQEKLDWVRTFVHEEIEPLDALYPGWSAPFERGNGVYREFVKPLQDEVKRMELWAAHLPPSLGGMGLGDVKLALLNEILGRSVWAPSVFGTQAPDSGNAEVLALYGTEDQKRKYLEPLLEGSIISTYAMTEPQGGSDPNLFTCRAELLGDEWVINGEKWMASHYPLAKFVIAMVITDPDLAVTKASSMILIPAGTPGMDLIRAVGLADEAIGEGQHGYVRFTDCRVPAENVLGGVGQGFVIAQTRLGGGRMHHAMRSLGLCQRVLEMQCERAVSRTTRGKLLSEQQAVSHMVADSWIQLEQFRLQVLHAAWQIEQVGYHKARRYISGVKAALPKTVMDIAYRGIQIHGSLGVTSEMPLAAIHLFGATLGLADGATEVHKNVVARDLLRAVSPADGLFPTEHLPARIEEARKKFGSRLEHLLANQ